jgi:hypothetical protein
MTALSVCNQVYSSRRERRIVMAITKYQPLSEERRAALRRDPDVVYRQRIEEPPTPFISELRVTGYIDTLELLGRRDDEDADEGTDDARGVIAIE